MVPALVSARLAVLHPIGAVILGLLGPGAIIAFAVLHGAGNGLPGALARLRFAPDSPLEGGGFEPSVPR
jgi:hypothetical protein